MESPSVILQKRITWFFVHSVLLQIFLLLTFTFSSLDVLHPLLWLDSAVSKATKPITWFYFCVLCVFLIALCGVIQKRFLLGPFLYTSIFNKIQSILSLSNLCNACLCAVVSVVISCLYSSVLGGEYSTFYHKCASKSGNCVVEAKVYLLFNAAWSGFYCFVCNYMSNTSFPVFPLIQQLKFHRLKAQISLSIRQSMKRAILPCALCPMLYFWKGTFVLHLVCDIFLLEIENELFKSVFDVFNFKLMFFAWLFTSIFLFTITIMERLLNILLTERCQFPIALKFGNTRTTTLQHVLDPNQSLIFQNWGYFDLLLIARCDYSRRQELFTLSQPGGHPNNWNAVLKECMKLIDTFSKKLNEACARASPKTNETSSKPILDTELRKQCTDPFTAHMRNLSASQYESMTFQYQQSLSEMPSVIWGQVIKYIASYYVKFKSILLKKPGFHYVFGRIPDAELKHVFCESLPVINAVQALAFLSIASVDEDSYGVVQRDLRAIVIAIADLKIVVDKALKIGNFKRIQKNECDVQMKTALKSALSQSMYWICITFKEYMLQLDFSPNTHSVLMGYIPVEDY